MPPGPDTSDPSQQVPIENAGGEESERRRGVLPSNDDFLLKLVKHCASHIDNHKLRNQNSLEREGTCEKLLHYIRNALPFLISVLQNKNQSSQSISFICNFYLLLLTRHSCRGFAALFEYGTKQDIFPSLLTSLSIISEKRSYPICKKLIQVIVSLLHCINKNFEEDYTVVVNDIVLLLVDTMVIYTQHLSERTNLLRQCHKRVKKVVADTHTLYYRAHHGGGKFQNNSSNDSQDKSVPGLTIETNKNMKQKKRKWFNEESSNNDSEGGASSNNEKKES